MGSSNSKQHRGQSAIHSRYKGPTEVTVERPRMEERAGKPVLNVPNSTYRILYIDPSQRLDVVARHGYIALRTDGYKAAEQADLEADLPGERRRRSTLLSEAGVDPFADPDGDAPALGGGAAVPKPTGDDDLSVNSGDEGDGKHSQHSGDAFGGTGVSRRSGTGGAAAADGANRTMNATAKHQQFLYPVGRYAQTKIFFEDKPGPGDFDEEYDGQNPAVYEREEDEVYEIGGVARIYPRPFEPTEADLTYELPSKVLDALRKAVDASMEAFAIDAEEGHQAEAAALAEFKAQAMEKMALVRDPFEEDQREQELIVLAAPTIDHGMTSEEAEAKAKNKRRKKLHKQINDWKDGFQAANGRKPTAEEMHSDPDFGPVYREYLALKKELKSTTDEVKDDPFASPDSAPAASGATNAATAAAIAAAPPRLPAHLPPTGSPQAAGMSPGDRGGIAAPLANGPQATYNALPDSEKFQVKQMVRKIRAWKNEHMALHGIPATKADIVNDHHVSDDYMQLRRRFGTDELDVSSDELAAKLEREAEKKRQKDAEAAAAQAPLTLEEQYERRKQLGKQLNEWKATFADANGRKPTATDIAADERVQALYDEYVSLPKPPADEGGIVNRASSSAAAEKSIEGLDERTAHKRKKQLGKELNAWKAQWADEHDGVPPTHADIEATPEILALYEEYKALQAVVSTTSRADVYSAVPDSPGAESPGAGGEDRAASKRKKQLGKELNAWKAQWAEEHDGEQPTHADIEADEAISPVYAEYKTLQAARRMSASVSRRGSVDPSRRKKQLGKDLNAWKASFELTNGRKPTSADIAENAIISAMYEEYQLLKGEARGDRSDSRSQSRMIDDEGGIRSPENGNGNTDTEVSEGSPSTSKSAHKRKKHLGKELNAWKATFLEANGAKPTVDDIMADDTIRPLYEEYMALKEGTSSAPAAVTPPVAATPVDDAEATHKRRKRLGKQLNEWKKAFKEEQGRAPTQDDIGADPEVKSWFDEYSALPKPPKDGADADGGDGAPAGSGDAAEAEAAAAAAAQAAEEKARKKVLVSQLNQWKAAFAAENDRAPTTQDILGDPDIAPIYEEYLLLSKRI